jgi:uncharacterized protein YdhG (YjbR/CyaY superfamily)
MATPLVDPRVKAYLAALPTEQRQALEQLRAQLRALVPDATETISYGMPTFKVNGRGVIGYAAWKNHLAIYPMSGELLERYADELAGYAGTKGSLHFTLDRPIPPVLLHDLVRARLADIEAKAKPKPKPKRGS